MDCKKHVSSNSPFIKVNEWSMYIDMGLAPAQNRGRLGSRSESAPGLWPAGMRRAARPALAPERRSLSLEGPIRTGARNRRGGGGHGGQRGGESQRPDRKSVV